MTLNLTLVTRDVIYQSADFRLTNVDLGGQQYEDSMKVLTLHYPNWVGFVTYTGVGQWFGRDTSERVEQWLSGIVDVSPTDVIDLLSARGTEFSRTIARMMGTPYPHTFILAAFADGAPIVAMISNFQTHSGSVLGSPHRDMSVDMRTRIREPYLLVTGRDDLISRTSRQRALRAARDPDISPAQIRYQMTMIHAEAAASPAAGGMVSPGCAVTSFRADGRGTQVLAGQGNVVTRSLTYGRATGDVLQGLGIDPRRVVSVTFSQSGLKPTIRPACYARLTSPDPASRYRLTELKHPDVWSAAAYAINGRGSVVGSESDSSRRLLVWRSDGIGDFIGSTGEVRGRGVNERDEAAMTIDMPDGSVRGARWARGQAAEELENDGGDLGDGFPDSGGVAINEMGAIAGWVSVSKSRRHRGIEQRLPALWIPGREVSVPADLGFAWGEALDVNDAGVVLILAGHVGSKVKAVLWDPVAGRTIPVGGSEPDGIYPSSLSADGVVLGTLIDASRGPVGCVGRGGGEWTPLGTPEGWRPAAMNNVGEVVGTVLQDGLERPWLRRTTGKLVLLPHFVGHDCRPNAITDNGLIAGSATTDHGSHAVRWDPE